MKRNTLRRGAIVAASLGVALLLGWLATAAGVLAPVRVTVEPAQRGPLTHRTFGIGTVEARRAYAVGPTAASRVLRVLVDEGDAVRAGQRLAELDPVDLDDRVASARLGAERAAHAARAAQAQLDEAGSRAALAEASARRFAELRAQGFYSAEAADAKRHEARAAASGVEAAAAMLAAARRDEARARADVAALDRVRANVRLVSPSDGIVSARLAEPGSTVVAGQPVVQLIDPSSLWVRARIDQAQAGALRVGQRASVVLRSDPARAHAAEVRRIDRVSDAVTEERIVHVGLLGAVDGLSVGEIAEVTIDVARLEDALSVPTAAIRRVDRREGVWRVRDDELAFHPVVIGASTPDGRTQVLSGLADGDPVVVHATRALEPDARVRVVDTLVAARP